MKKIELNSEIKQLLLEEIRGFYQKERGEEISDFQASFFLTFILDNIGPYIYNQAIADAHSLMTEKLEELYDLEKRFR